MDESQGFPTVNAAFPYDAEVAAARRYLEARGIREPKPLYRSITAPAQTAGPAARRARTRWFPPSAAGRRRATDRARSV